MERYLREEPRGKRREPSHEEEWAISAESSPPSPPPSPPSPQPRMFTITAVKSEPPSDSDEPRGKADYRLQVKAIDFLNLTIVWTVVSGEDAGPIPVRPQLAGTH